MKRKIIEFKKNNQVLGRGRHPPLTDYSVYIFSMREKIVYITFGLLFMGMTAYLFYDSIVAFILLLPFTSMLLKDKKRVLCQKRKQQLEIEFRDVILSVSSNIRTGYSIENAFGEAYKEIIVLYGKDCLMARELNLLLRRLENNEQLEDILFNLAKRSTVQDIKDFADIFQIAKRGGGNMRAIIADTADIIGGKQEVRIEIDTVMSEKKLEQTIMRYIPFFIIFYISISSKGYFEILYHNIIGQLVMTAALIVYFAACRISDRILDIEI